MKKRFNGIHVLVLALCGVALGVVMTWTAFSARLVAVSAGETGDADGIYGAYSAAAYKTAEVMACVDYYFVEDVDLDELADGAAEGIIEATGDIWSYYVPAEDMDTYNEYSENTYVGVGVTIYADEEYPEGFVVEEVIRGGPAGEAGVQPLDVLTQVEGQSVTELGMTETKNLVRGEAGTDITLTLEREGEPYTVTLTRAKVEEIITIGELLEGSIGLVTIDNFSEHSAEQTMAVIADLMEQGAEALIFDVRFNPGGYREELVEILDLLLPEGVLFRSISYNGKEEIDTSDAGFLDLPMVVLVNEDSYSAAEFFAACLQEYGAAQVVGMPTCGKGYFQQTIPLSDGSALNLSTGTYYLPSGKSLKDVGITPDVEIDLEQEQYIELYRGVLSHGEDAQLQAALDILKQQSAD